MVLAPIERLPVELLQPIFIAAGYNIALIESSSYIAARLSSHYIYHSTCDYYLTKVHGKRGELSAAQTCMFGSKWMTWDFFKSWIIRRYGSTGCLCGRTQKEGCFDAQWPPNFEDASQMIFSRSHLPQIAFVKGRIPTKLLSSPWTQEKIEFLRFLLWITAMTVDWMDPNTAHVAVDGRKQAMLERNLEAVELFNHNRRLGRPADLAMVRFAVIDAGCDRSIVYDTLLAANMWYGQRSARYSPELHQWCESRIVNGDPKGRWMQTKLRESCIVSTQEEAQKVREHVGQALDHTTETYDGGPEDIFTTHKLSWNEVRSFGSREESVCRSSSTDYNAGYTMDIGSLKIFNRWYLRNESIGTVSDLLPRPLSRAISKITS